VIDDLETKGHEVHTIKLVLNGQHGEFDLTVEATTDTRFLEDVTATGIAHRSGGVTELVVVEPEPEEVNEDDELIEYRVTIEGWVRDRNAEELWEYTVEDETEDGAKQQAVALAVNDGLASQARHDIKVEEL
jgi:hypothetical protein